MIMLMNMVRQAPSLNEKVSLLKARRGDLLDMIIKDAMDPAITYGVTSKGIAAPEWDGSTGQWYAGFHEILQKLTSNLQQQKIL